MSHDLRAILILLAGLSVAGPIEAQTQERTPLLASVIQCRGLTDAAQRLACYDAATLALDEAERSGEVTVVDRGQVREARDRLFGFNVQSLGLFGRQDEPRVEAIETTLTSARQFGRGEWLFTLADGSVWRQTDSERLPSPPRAGASVRIREAAMGSYLLSVAGGRSVRARREQ